MISTDYTAGNSQGSRASRPNLIDEEYIDSVFGAPDMLPMKSLPLVVDMFDADNREQIRALDFAVKCYDWNAIRFQAHNIGGAARALGASHLAGLLQDLDRAAKAADVPHTKAYLTEIRKWYKPSLLALRHYAKQHMEEGAA